MGPCDIFGFLLLLIDQLCLDCFLLLFLWINHFDSWGRLEVGFEVEFINHDLCSFQALPADLTRLPLLEKLYLENNKLSVLPPELGEIKSLKVLRVDFNFLVSVPGKHCFLKFVRALGHGRNLI